MSLHVKPLIATLASYVYSSQCPSCSTSTFFIYVNGIITERGRARENLLPPNGTVIGGSLTHCTAVFNHFLFFQIKEIE